MLTRREKHVLIIVAAIAVIFAKCSSLFLSQLTFNQFLEGYEALYLFFVVMPLGFYISTDPERRKKE